jgi:hypothetical protein
MKNIVDKFTIPDSATRLSGTKNFYPGAGHLKAQAGTFYKAKKKLSNFV